MPSRPLLYVYGLVPSRFADAVRPPAGLDDAPVRVETVESLMALVSDLPAEHYAPAQVEARSGDVAWLSPRARAHDAVLTWAQDQGGVIPFPMFTLFGSPPALAAALAPRADAVAAVFARVRDADEYGLRLHRVDQAMLAAVDTLDPDVAQLRAAAEQASPGQRYLLERKLTEQAKLAVKSAGQRVAREVFERLRALSRDAVARSLVPDAERSPDTTLVLNGAFLVERQRADDFRAAVGSLVREYEPRGLRFDFTGPWPPYHFVDDARATHE